MQIEELNEVKEQVSNCFYGKHAHARTHTHTKPTIVHFFCRLKHLDVYFAPKNR